MTLSADELVEILAAHGDGPGTGIWVVNEDGSTSVLPDQDTIELRDRGSWPVYITRVETMNLLVWDRGLMDAIDQLNFLLATATASGSVRSLMRTAAAAGYTAAAAWLAQRKDV